MKSLACIFGRHRWATRIEQGETYKVCSACGTVPKGPSSGPHGSGTVNTTEGGGGA
jgi:hypothetical protein